MQRIHRRSEAQQTMLLVSHVGYCLGAAWALSKATSREPANDYRVLAAMAIAPDIIDRSLFVFAMPRARSGRLVAHTLLFNALSSALMLSVNRNWWLYGLTSASHLLLDLPKDKVPWLRHVLWPLTGSDLSLINISDEPEGGPYWSRTWRRFRKAAEPYRRPSSDALRKELGGFMVLAAFFLGKGLYRGQRLRQFVRSGNV